MVNLNDFLSKHKFEYTILNSNNLSEITFSSIGIGINDYIFIADSNYGGDYVNSHITILDSSDMSHLLNCNKKIIYSGILIVISTSMDTNLSEMLNKLHKENDISTIIHIASRLDSNYFYSELIKYKNDSFEYFQNSLVNECINLMDLLSKDVEIEAIVSTAYKILKNPLIILDKYHRIVAHTSSFEIHDPIWKTLIDDKYCSPSLLKIIGYNDFWLRLDKSNEPLFIDNVKFSSNARKALFPIKVRDKSRGYVALLESSKKISPNDLQILKIISKAIAIKFSKEDMVSKAAEMLSENLTKELLLGRMPNEGLASIHCEALGWNLNNYFSVLEIKHLSGSKLTDNSLKLISTILKDIFPLCVHTNNTKRAYFLISFKNRKNLYKTAYYNLEAIMKEKN
ncbi:hypothetical protein [Clostridium oryzae]|uniref:Uncharacterized protein n=1 Tax=Clostridium oryzae TaxID=1450648 RepID=A0A1V4IDK9_9CLOT|nr:hypothetical protein [Clostridium oryzae]OPJ57607.1 hypothetical protein CLORY_40250 [Clostridium oryzae]